MNVLLVDDHALLRDGVAMMMARDFPGVQLAQAGSLAEARAQIARRPDVDLLLLDLALPDGDGIDALPSLREALPDARLVVLSADESNESVVAAINAGAAGFIPKRIESHVMLRALRAVLAGGIYLPPASTERRAVARPDNGAVQAPEPEEIGLSPRQSDVLRMLIDGKSNKLIQRELVMSESTVKTHLAAIFRKLDANSRTQAVVAAARLGLRLGPRRAD